LPALRVTIDRTITHKKPGFDTGPDQING